MPTRNTLLRPAMMGAAVSLLLLSLSACEGKTKPEVPPAAATTAGAGVSTAPQATATQDDERHGADAPESLEEARAEGHREGMDMERDAHEGGMEMGAKAHADGMSTRGDNDAMSMKKADPPMKMDGHM